jgi:hypothetical protein
LFFAQPPYSSPWSKKPDRGWNRRSRGCVAGQQQLARKRHIPARPLDHDRGGGDGRHGRLEQEKTLNAGMAAGMITRRDRSTHPNPIIRKRMSSASTAATVECIDAFPTQNLTAIPATA